MAVQYFHFLTGCLHFQATLLSPPITYTAQYNRSAELNPVNSEVCRYVYVPSQHPTGLFEQHHVRVPHVGHTVSSKGNLTAGMVQNMVECVAKSEAKCKDGSTSCIPCKRTQLQH
jgi:hypothetical protein